jgi:mannitol/fructose-specific phosphotransferase system IIA component (Ntr-type)
MSLPTVNLSDYISEDRIVSLDGGDKDTCLARMVEVLSQAPEIRDGDALLRAILERENILSTGIGFGIAVPHAKIPSVSSFVMALGISSAGVDYDSMDGKPVHIVVMIAGPDGQQDQYLRILAKVTLLLRNDEVRSTLQTARPSEIVQVFRTR